MYKYLTRSYIGSIFGPNLAQEYSTGGDISVLHSTTTDFPYGAYLVLTDEVKAASDGLAIGRKIPLINTYFKLNKCFGSLTMISYS